MLQYCLIWSLEKIENPVYGFFLNVAKGENCQLCLIFFPFNLQAGEWLKDFTNIPNSSFVWTKGLKISQKKRSQYLIKDQPNASKQREQLRFWLKLQIVMKLACL